MLYGKSERKQQSYAMLYMLHYSAIDQ